MFSKCNAYAKLKNFLYTRKINYVKAEVIFFNFQNLINNLVKIKENFSKKKLIKHLNHWRLASQINAKLRLLKDEIKQSIAEKNRKKIEDSEKTKAQKENENLKIKNEIAKNQEIEANLNAKVKEFEEKELLLMQNIQILENEKKLIEEEIMIFSTEKDFLQRKEKVYNSFKVSNKDKDFSISPDKTSGYAGDYANNNSSNKGRNGTNSNGKANKNFKGKKEILLGLEKKISEYEKKINKLTEANFSKDTEISLYVKEMNEIISKHEKTSNYFIS